MNQGMQMAYTETRKGKGINSPLEPPAGTQPPEFDFRAFDLLLQENKFMLPSFGLMG